VVVQVAAVAADPAGDPGADADFLRVSRCDRHGRRSQCGTQGHQSAKKKAAIHDSLLCDVMVFTGTRAGVCECC